MSSAAWTTLRRGLPAALTLATLACVPAAQAQRAPGVFATGVPVDGPSADVRAVGQVDVARDGGAAISYVRREAGEDHAFLSLADAGVPGPGFRIDGGLPALQGRPAVAASDGGRVVAVFANASGVFASVRPDGGQGFGAPQQLGGPGASDPVVDMALTGVAYAAWTENGDVRAAYLPRRTAGFSGYPVPLDADPGRAAGTGAALAPRVSASSDGTGVVVWGEQDGGTSRVMARRLVRSRVSAVVTEATLGTFEGRAGRSADMADVGIEDDSSYAWVAFRQALDDGAGGTITRAVARRLRGSGFDDPVAVDGAPPSGAVGPPRVGINGRGQGITTVETPGGTVVGSVVRDDLPGGVSALGLAGGVPALPVAASGENYDGVVAWNQAAGPGTAATVRARTLEDDPGLPVAPPFGAEAVLSDPALGPVDTSAGLDADVDRAGDAVIAFIQGGTDDRRLVVAAFDRAPGAPSGTTTTNWRRSSRPALAWAPAFDVWSGGMSYQVLLDGQPLAVTGAANLIPPAPIPDGTHTWQVIATDRRGQVARSATRNLRIDATPPEIAMKITGRRQAGKPLKIRVTTIDERPPSGSGTRQVRLDFGDRTRPIVIAGDAATFPHTFRRGRFTLRASARDNAGNTTVLRRTIQIAKAKKGKRKARR